MSFHGSIVSFLVLNNIPFSGCIKVYLFIYILKDILAISKFLTIVNEVAKKSLCADLHVNISFQLLLVNIQKYKLLGKSIFSL